MGAARLGWVGCVWAHVCDDYLEKTGGTWHSANSDASVSMPYKPTLPFTQTINN
jgi:hypothetical protein